MPHLHSQPLLVFYCPRCKPLSLNIQCVVRPYLRLRHYRELSPQMRNNRIIPVTTILRWLGPPALVHWTPIHILLEEDVTRPVVLSSMIYLLAPQAPWEGRSDTDRNANHSSHQPIHHISTKELLLDTQRISRVRHRRSNSSYDGHHSLREPICCANGCSVGCRCIDVHEYDTCKVTQSKYSAQFD